MAKKRKLLVVWCGRKTTMILRLPFPFTHLIKVFFLGIGVLHAVSTTNFIFDSGDSQKDINSMQVDLKRLSGAHQALLFMLVGILTYKTVMMSLWYLADNMQKYISGLEPLLLGHTTSLWTSRICDV